MVASEWAASVSFTCPGNMLHALMWVLLLACSTLLLRVACKLQFEPQPPKLWSVVPLVPADLTADDASSKGSSALERPIRRLNFMGLLTLLLPHIVSAFGAIQLWSVAVACKITDSIEEQDPIAQSIIVWVASPFIDMHLLLVGCCCPSSETSLALGWLFPHAVFAILILLSLAEGVSRALFRCLRWKMQAATSSAPLPMDQLPQPFILMLKHRISDALCAQILHLQVSRVSIARQAFKGMIYMISKIGLLHVVSWSISLWTFSACLAILINVITPSALLFHYMPLAKGGQGSTLKHLWSKTLSFTAPSELWAKTRQITDLLVVGCFELGLASFNCNVRHLWFMAAEVVLVVEVFFMVGRRWRIRPTNVHPFLIERVILLFSFYILITSPRTDVACTAAALSVLVVGATVSGLIAITVSAMRMTKPDHREGRPQANILRASARALSAMALHFMTASHLDFHDFCDRLSYDDRSCLEAAGAIVKRQLYISGSFDSSLAASMSVEWASSVASSRSIQNGLDAFPSQKSIDHALPLDGDDSPSEKDGIHPVVQRSTNSDDSLDSRWPQPVPALFDSRRSLPSILNCSGPLVKSMKEGSTSVLKLGTAFDPSSCRTVRGESKALQSSVDMLPQSESFDHPLRDKSALLFDEHKNKICNAMPFDDPLEGRLATDDAVLSEFKCLESPNEVVMSSSMAMTAVPTMTQPCVDSTSKSLHCLEPLHKSMKENEAVSERSEVLDSSTCRTSVVGKEQPQHQGNLLAQQEHVDDQLDDHARLCVDKKEEGNWDAMSGKTAMTSFTTVSEQGRRDLKKAWQSGLGVDGLTGEEVKASGKNWISSEAEQSKALMQRYAVHATQKEKRMSKLELTASRKVTTSNSEHLAQIPTLQCLQKPSTGEESPKHFFSRRSANDKGLRLVDVRSDCGSSDPFSDAEGPERIDSDMMESSTGSQSLPPSWDSEKNGWTPHRFESEVSVREVGEMDSQDLAQSVGWAKWRTRKESRKDRLFAKAQKKGLANTRWNSSQSSDRSMLSTSSRCSSLDAGIFQLAENFSQRQVPSETGTKSSNTTCDFRRWQVPKDQESHRRSWGSHSCS